MRLFLRLISLSSLRTSNVLPMYFPRTSSSVSKRFPEYLVGHVMRYVAAHAAIRRPAALPRKPAPTLMQQMHPFMF